MCRTSRSDAGIAFAPNAPPGWRTVIRVEEGVRHETADRSGLGSGEHAVRRVRVRGHSPTQPTTSAGSSLQNGLPSDSQITLQTR